MAAWGEDRRGQDRTRQEGGDGGDGGGGSICIKTVTYIHDTPDLIHLSLNVCTCMCICLSYIHTGSDTLPVDLSVHSHLCINFSRGPGVLQAFLFSLPLLS